MIWKYLTQSITLYHLENKAPTESPSCIRWIASPKIGAIDSIFNPVTKVTYNVQPVPGAKDPIEILSIEVETDGSVTPQDAISHSATVLMNHLRLVEAIAKPEVLEVTEKISEEIIKIRKLLNLTID